MEKGYMTKEAIKKGFNAGAKEYDSARKQLIPCFDEFYGSALDLITSVGKKSFKVLDLGAGTGLFSALVAQHYPEATFTLYDISSGMLQEAKTRFTDQALTAEYVAIDYATQAITGHYDLIISALSIHHLTGEEKATLFKKVYVHLHDNGLFINADQVLGETATIEQQYRDIWLRQVKENGVSDSALASALERMKEDKMSTLAEQLNWLKGARFSEVNCSYHNNSFVVYSGQKGGVFS